MESIKDNSIVLIPVPLNDFVSGLTKCMVELLQSKLEQIPQLSTKGNNPLYNKPVTEKELCAYFRISAPTAIRWRKKGKIPFIMIGSAIRYNLEAVEKALETKSRGRPRL